MAGEQMTNDEKRANVLKWAESQLGVIEWPSGSNKVKYNDWFYGAAGHNYAWCMGTGYSGDFWDFFSGKTPIADVLPVGVVLTIAAAGSEGSDSCVITLEEGNLKWGCPKSDLLRPKFAVLDPRLTCSLPAYQTASGATDMAKEKPDGLNHRHQGKHHPHRSGGTVAVQLSNKISVRHIIDRRHQHTDDAGHGQFADQPPHGLRGHSVEFFLLMILHAVTPPVFLGIFYIMYHTRCTFAGGNRPGLSDEAVGSA